MRMEAIAEVSTGVPRGNGFPVSRSRMRRMPARVGRKGGEGDSQKIHIAIVPSMGRGLPSVGASA